MLICCLHVLNGIDNGHPEAGWLLDCLAEYALAKPPPLRAPVMTVNQLGQILRVD